MSGPEGARGDTAFVQWALASRPMRGQAVSGDQAVVLVSGPRTIMAVIDGLGHGPEAADAARRAADVIDRHPAEPLEVLLLLVHRELDETRGAAATVAIVDAERSTLHWLGIGNVEGVMRRADIEARPRTHGVFLVSGVLGHHLGRIHVPEPLALAHGDVVALATDGVRANLAEVVRIDLTPDRLADSILAKHGQPDDDALVLVARYQVPDRASWLDGDDHDRTRRREQPDAMYRPLNPPSRRPTGQPDHDKRFGPLGPSSNR